MTSNHQVGTSCYKWELRLQVGNGEERVGHVFAPYRSLPFACYGGDAAAQHGGWAGVGEWKQIFANLVVVEEYNVAHIIIIRCSVDWR